MQPEYLESPLHQYTLGTALTCSNQECSVYGKTVFKLAQTTSFIYHKKIVWTCGSCKSKQTMHVDH